MIYPYPSIVILSSINVPEPYENYFELQMPMTKNNMVLIMKHQQMKTQIFHICLPLYSKLLYLKRNVEGVLTLKKKMINSQQLMI